MDDQHPKHDQHERITPPPVPPAAPRPPRSAQVAAPAAVTPTDARRFRAWMWVATSLLAVMLVAVSVPLAATLYGVHLLAAFATGLMLAGALPLAVRWPWVAGAVATAGLLWFAILSAESTGAPWPWPVTTIISQGALLIVLGVILVRR